MSHLIVDIMGIPSTTYGLSFIVLTAGCMFYNFCSGLFPGLFGIDRMIRIGNVLNIASMTVELAFAL